jgi:pimeloyl-ACP methyl ester carboxylesterase
MQSEGQTTTRRADAGGIGIAYDDTGGDGPALLAMPGWCGGRSLFAPLLPMLSPRHRVLAMDWRGHGGSDPAPGETGLEELVADAEAVIRDSGARSVIPLTVSHAGFVALELRRRLGARVPAVVLTDWIVLDPPPPFAGALRGLQDAGAWRGVRDALFAMWLGAAPPAAVAAYVHGDMGRYPAATWAQAGRMIEGAYAREGTPLSAFARLPAPVPVLHLYAQPRDGDYLAAQQAFARGNPWFQVARLDGQTHFPTIESPAAVARAVSDFIGHVAAGAGRAAA